MLLVRTFTNPRGLIDAIGREIAHVDRLVAVRPPDTLNQSLDRFIYAQPRFTLVVLSLFAFSGTVLVAIGVFSVMA